MIQSLLAALFNQHARLLELKPPLPDASLIVERFSGREAVSESFRFDIDCVSTNTHFDLKSLVGEEIILRLLQLMAASAPGTATSRWPCNSVPMVALPATA